MKIDLDIEFHLKSMEPAVCKILTSRFEYAAHWVAQRFDKRSFIVSIAIVDDATIHRLNREQLQHDWPTDCISFVFESGDEVHGEVIASWDTAQRLSSLARWSPEDELTLYVLHGMLHLAGMDDADESGRAAMRLTERDYVQSAEFPGANTYLDRFDDVAY